MRVKYQNEIGLEMVYPFYEKFLYVFHLLKTWLLILPKFCENVFGGGGGYVIILLFFSYTKYCGFNFAQPKNFT